MFAESTGEVSAKLTADLNLTNTVEVNDGQAITLEMDGYTLTATTQETPDDPADLPSFTAIRVSEGGHFSVEDGTLSSNSPGTTLLAVEGGNAIIADMIMTVTADGSKCLSV
ncbi:MAG: hypothetical protein IJT94_05885, partial [Oscillibacter sp.]|nr:hypothetical protein [Oscillibacter sp.]